MPKMTRTYRPGDVCFAKVRGYPAWPARVEGTADETVNKFKYHVFFFGTGETAVLKAEEIFPYFENKDKFDKPVKRKGYKEGLLDLQAYVIHNNLKEDPALEEVDDSKPKDSTKKKGLKKIGKRSSISTENEEDVNTTADSSMLDTTAEASAMETMDEETEGENSKMNTEDTSVADKSAVEEKKDESSETKKEGNKTKVSPKKGGGKTTEPAEDFTSDGSEEFSLVIDETPNKGGFTGPKAAGHVAIKRNAAQKRKKPSAVDSGPEDSPAVKRIKRASLPASISPLDGAVTSRSGRKIKPKKFADDVGTDESFDISRTKSVTIASGTPPSSLTKASSEPAINDFKEFADLAGPLYTEADSEGLPIRDETNHGYKGRIILVKSPNGQLCKLRIDFLRPKTFPSEKARMHYDEAVARNARKLKMQIKEGSFTIEEYLENCKHILANQDRKRVEKTEHKKGKMKLVCWLRSEQRILEIDCHLKVCLSLTKADVDTCLDLLDELGALVIDPLMLKKHPSVVETIKKLRKYIGNTSSWDMTEEQALNFKSKASLIRMKAEQLYSKLRSLFCVPAEESFWTAFTKKVDEFRDVTNNLHLKEICNLIEDPTIVLCNDELKQNENDDTVVEPEAVNGTEGEEENRPPVN